jgi:hypothetical protein
MQTFDNSNQLHSFMKKEADRLHISINNAYNTYFARGMLRRISSVDNNNEILVKGSSAEITYLGSLVRAITDVDIASIHNFQANSYLLGKIIGDCHDGFNLEMNSHIKKTPTGIYKMKFNANMDKTKQPISVDFQENYGRLIEPQRKVMPKLFQDDEEFEINLPSFEEYLAEKLCIVAESNKSDVLNTRVKDFYDIYQLHGGKYDSEKLTAYFKKMLALRGKINIGDVKTNYLNTKFITDAQGVWDSTKKKYDFLDKEIDLAGAVYYTRAVIREELQKNGQKMDDNIEAQYVKKNK